MKCQMYENHEIYEILGIKWMKKCPIIHNLLRVVRFSNIWKKSVSSIFQKHFNFSYFTQNKMSVIITRKKKLCSCCAKKFLYLKCNCDIISLSIHNNNWITCNYHLILIWYFYFTRIKCCGIYMSVLVSGTYFYFKNHLMELCNNVAMYT